MISRQVRSFLIASTPKSYHRVAVAYLCVHHPNIANIIGLTYRANQDNVVALVMQWYQRFEVLPFNSLTAQQTMSLVSC